MGQQAGEYMKDEGVDRTQNSWDHTWREFLRYAQRGLGGDGQGKRILRINEETAETRVREPYPTLYPGEIVGDTETRKEERDAEGKRMRLAKEEDGTRVVSDAPERKIGRGKWEMLPRQEDTAARRLLSGQDGRGTYRVFKDDTMELAHEEEYAGHPLLRLFTRPEEMENGQHTRMSKADISHMNGADGKKLTHKTLQVAMALHERHDFYLAVATDGAKRGETQDKMESQKISETTYGVWLGPESAGIVRDKREKARAIQQRLGIKLN
eukprot:6184462-Pleurochrysis_carterae.AAC.1